MTIFIGHLHKPLLVAALYREAQPDPSTIHMPLTGEEVSATLRRLPRTHWQFGLVKGRVLNLDLRTAWLNEHPYERANPGVSVQEIVRGLEPLHLVGGRLQGEPAEVPATVAMSRYWDALLRRFQSGSSTREPLFDVFVQRAGGNDHTHLRIAVPDGRAVDVAAIAQRWGVTFVVVDGTPLHAAAGAVSSLIEVRDKWAGSGAPTARRAIPLDPELANAWITAMEAPRDISVVSIFGLDPVATMRATLYSEVWDAGSRLLDEGTLASLLPLPASQLRELENACGDVPPLF